MVIDELHPPTPLHTAAQAGKASLVKSLLAQGGDVDAPAGGGATALHHAASRYVHKVKSRQTFQPAQDRVGGSGKGVGRLSPDE